MPALSSLFPDPPVILPPALLVADMPDVKPAFTGPPAIDIPDVVLDPKCAYYRLAAEIEKHGGPEWAVVAERVRYLPITAPRSAWFTVAGGETQDSIDRSLDHYLGPNYQRYYDSPLTAAFSAALNFFSSSATVEGSDWWSCWYGYARYRDPLPDRVRNKVLPPLPTKQWEVREMARFGTNGTYFELPWAKDLAPIPRHYAHVSTADPTMVAFTEDDRKGVADRQTRMKPGRYLSKFYPDMDPDDVRKYAAMLDASFTKLHFATTADEIEEVYTNGPPSCMSHDASDYESHMHPVRVYAAGDLAVAYTKKPNGEVSGRCLVWPDKMERGRIYGDIDRMKLLLKAAGYGTGESSLRGAKLLKVKDRYGGGWVMPYIDNSNSFGESDCGEFFVIGGDHDAASTSGIVSEGTYCPFYDEYVDASEDDFTYVHDVGESWSPRAVENHAFYCDHTGRTYSNDHGSHDVRVRRVMRSNGTTAYWSAETWSQDAVDDDAWYCEVTDQYYANHVEGAVVEGYDGPVCPEWAEKNCTVCAVSGDLYETSELVENKAGELVHPDHLDDDDAAEDDTAAAA